MEDFRKKFKLYAGPLGCMDQQYLKRTFLNELKVEIRPKLKLHQVETLSEMMYYAQMIDEKNSALRIGGFTTGGIIGLK